jgi:hypothetical protein
VVVSRRGLAVAVAAAAVDGDKEQP